MQEFHLKINNSISYPSKNTRDKWEVLKSSSDTNFAEKMYKGDRPAFKEEGLREGKATHTSTGHQTFKNHQAKKKSGLPCHFSLTKRYMADSKIYINELKDNYYFQQQARFIRTERQMTKKH